MTNRIDSPEFQREFNKACAEFVGKDVVYVGEDRILVEEHFRKERIFDPYNDANDRDDVIKAMKLDICYWESRLKTVDNVWSVSTHGKAMRAVGAEDKSRRVAIIKCIAKVLGVDCE